MPSANYVVRVEVIGGDGSPRTFSCASGNGETASEAIAHLLASHAARGIKFGRVEYVTWPEGEPRRIEHGG
jgi:hypothetical protein